MASKWYRQPGYHRGRVGVGHEAKRKEQPLFSWALSESVSATVFLLPGDLAPGLLPFSIQRTKASREERHTQAEVGEAGVQSPGPALKLHGILSQGRVSLIPPFHLSHHPPSGSVGS